MHSWTYSWRVKTYSSKCLHKILSSLFLMWMFLIIKFQSIFFVFDCFFPVAKLSGGMLACFMDRFVIQSSMFIITSADGTHTTHCSGAWMAKACSWGDWAFSVCHSGNALWDAAKELFWKVELSVWFLVLKKGSISKLVMLVGPWRTHHGGWCTILDEWYWWRQ